MQEAPQDKRRVGEDFSGTVVVLLDGSSKLSLHDTPCPLLTSHSIVSPFASWPWQPATSRTMYIGFAIHHSHSALMKPSAFAFSETARFVWSWAPLGKVACSSTPTFTSALGSAVRMAMISSAI